MRAARDFIPVNEIIVVNNSPLDRRASADAAAAGATVLENTRNRGFAAAVNQAIQRSAADYVILVNPDVVEVRGIFGAIAEILDRDPNAAAVGIRLENEDGALQDSCRRSPGVFDFVAESVALSRRVPRWRRPRRFRMLDWEYDEQRVVDAASGALLVLRRAALEAVGPFDERFFVYGEELDWLVRAKRAGWRTYFTPDVCAVHVGGGSSDASRAHLSLLLQASWHAYARKHLGLPRSLALRTALTAIDATRLLLTFARGRASQRRAFRQRVRLHLGFGVSRRYAATRAGR
jgi:GT2 family glycosyltransferase